MSKIKNGGLDQYGTEPVEQQQFDTAGVEGVKIALLLFFSLFMGNNNTFNIPATHFRVVYRVWIEDI